MCKHCKKNTNNNGQAVGLGLVLGAVIGGTVAAAAAILTAPQSGEETRKKLKVKGNEVWKDSVKNLEKFNSEKIEPILQKVETKIKSKKEAFKKTTELEKSI